MTLTATAATCGPFEVAEYRFAYSRIGTGIYTEIQGWSNNLTANWDTTGLAAGQYDLIVYTRAAGASSPQGAAHANYFINDICTSATLATSPAGPQPPGTNVNLTATAGCNGAATPEFRFVYRLTTGGAWTEIQNWGSGNAVWNTTGLATGTYNLLVYARAQGNLSSWEAFRYGTYQLGGSCNSVTLSTSPASPQLPGTIVGLSATSSCDAGLTPEYRFYYQVPGNQTWFLIQDWNGATANWDTTGLMAGVHTLRADVRAVENGTGSEAVDYESYTLSGLGYASIAVGMNYTSCAVVNDGTARCWGENSDGQLGNGTTNNSSTPVTVTGLSGASGVAPGGWHSCAVRTDSTLRCWGQNTFGQLGNGSTTSSLVPVTVSGISDAVSVSSGTYHSCALRSGGTVVCWGDNTFGQIGDGTMTGPVTTPTAVTGVSGATAVFAGGWHSCAIVGGGVVCWGNNDFGQIGNGSANATEPTPVSVTGISGATALATGDSHNCALQSGAPKCWGFNGFGQLGNGTTTDSSTPVNVALTAMTTVSAGYAHSCARKYPDGTLRCWGDNTFGELGDGSTTSSTTPVTVFGHHLGHFGRCRGWCVHLLPAVERQRPLLGLQRLRTAGGRHYHELVPARRSPGPLRPNGPCRR